MTGPFSADVGVEALRVQLGEVLADSIGTPVHVTAAPSYADLLASVARGEVQIAWMPPGMVVRALDDHGATLLCGSVRARGPRYHSVLFVSAKSQHRELEDLRGGLVAWVDPDSCAGYLFPRMALLERGLDPETFFASQQMLGSHDAVVHAVDEGAVDAGATFANYPAGAEPLGRPQSAGWFAPLYPAAMRPLLTSEPIPSDAVVATRDIDETTRTRAAETLTRLHTLPGGATLLEALFNAARFEPTDAGQYDSVRRALAAR